MSLEDAPEQDPVRPDRREHGGAPLHPDDDELALRTERERVEAGLEPYAPDDVPPATDVEAEYDPTQTEDYQGAVDVIERQEAEGELAPISDDNPFPPTRYDDDEGG